MRPGLGLLLTITALAACGNGDSDAEDLAKVYKSDGSVQCEEDSGIAPEVMAQELVGAGIDVLCAQKASAGIGVAAVCGNWTGTINVFEIRAANVEDAEALGFAAVTALPDYLDAPCEP